MTHDKGVSSGVARLSSLLTGLIIIFVVAVILFGPNGLTRMTEAPIQGGTVVQDQG